MPYTIEDQALAQRYFRYELTEAEVVAFEDRVDKDEEFGKAVALYGAMEEAVLTRELAEIQELVEVMELQVRKKRLRMIVFSMLGVAASVAIIFFWLGGGGNEEKMLFANHYKTPTDSLLDKSGEVNLSRVSTAIGQSEAEQLKEGVVAYRNGKFEEAEDYFEMSIEKNASLTEAYYYRGACRLELGKYEGAAEDFVKVRDGAPADMLDMIAGATWYEALARVRLGQYGRAKTLLELLSDVPEYQTKAKGLINEISGKE